MSSRPSERVVYQDYIAKIRYSNQLPPPPNPPKLLDIPGTGLDDSKYTSAGYASRLVREQALNIEADAELGMPIDLVGIPGVFEGDERAIQADPNPRSLHPSDKALLRPLSTLSKTGIAADHSSYLRRTEYTASSGPQMFASGSSKDLLRLQNDPRRKKQISVDKEDPKNILQSVVKSFDIAYPQDAANAEGTRGSQITGDEIKAWTNPKHPTDPSLHLLDSYSILPDLDSLPEAGSYIVCKFITNPVAATDRYDERLDSALLQPISDDAIEEAYLQKHAEWDPASDDPEPLPNFEYDYFLPAAEAVRNIKRKFDPTDPDHDDDELYTEEGQDGQRSFKFARVRRYETYHQTGDPRNAWNDSVALALYDPDLDVGEVPGAKRRLAKGAYLYPVSQRTALRPQRKVGALSQASSAIQDVIDELDIKINNVEEDDATFKMVQEIQSQWDPMVKAPTTQQVAA